VAVQAVVAWPVLRARREMRREAARGWRIPFDAAFASALHIARSRSAAFSRSPEASASSSARCIVCKRAFTARLRARRLRDCR